MRALALTQSAPVPRWQILGFCLGAGGILGLGHAPYDFPWGALVAFPVALRLLVSSADLRIAALRGWLIGSGYFGLTLTWIVEPFLVDLARHGWMAPFALVLLSAGLALFWGAGFALAHWVARRHGVPRQALALALGLTLAEVARATLLTGFPWALYAYAWLETPVIQLAAFAGPHLLGALLILCLGCLASLRIGHVSAGVLGLVAMGVLGLNRAPLQSTGLAPAEINGPMVRLVQPNAAQHLKWQPEMMRVFYARLIDATSAPAPEPLSAVIWPETSVPFLLGERLDLLEDLAAAASGKTPLILGLRRRDAEGHWYNTLAAVGPQGQVLARYDKHHLVPFGEYLPLLGLLDRLGWGDAISGLAGSFRPGSGPARISIPGLPDFQPLICYEAIFPHEILRGSDRPAWLLQITNDAWFGTFSGPYQHIAQARVRAIEYGLPIARAANTGVTAMIGPRGEVLASLPLGTAGYIDTALPIALPPTIYARTPHLLAPLLLLLGLLALRIRRRG